jgi:CRISPR-associated protein Csb2
VLALDIQLLDGRYDAATTDRSVPEWPPHPARAFCALVAGARAESDFDALRWLERQPAPNVVAAEKAVPLRRSAYVVTNRTDKGGGSQFHPGRTNQLRTRVGVLPESDAITFEWPDLEVPPDILTRLDNLAGLVPYLGRSTGVALAAITANRPKEIPDRMRFRAVDLASAQAILRVPFEGYLAQLQDAYEDGLPASDVAGRLLGYRADRLVSETSGRVARPFGEMLVLRLPGVRPEGSLTPRYTAALRAAMMARIPDPVPAVVHGHGLDGISHVAYLGLLDAGPRTTARGNLLALALALPQIDRDDRRKIIRAAVGDAPTPWELNVPGVGAVDVQFDEVARGPWGATAGRWTQAAANWVTVTPIAFDRHPKRPDQLIEVLRQSFTVAGYPEPASAEVSSTPLTGGAVRFTRRDLPVRLQNKMMRHVRVRFDQAVSGPLVVGAGRYLGVGLLVPEPGS